MTDEQHTYDTLNGSTRWITFPLYPVTMWVGRYTDWVAVFDWPGAPQDHQTEQGDNDYADYFGEPGGEPTPEALRTGRGATPDEALADLTRRIRLHGPLDAKSWTPLEVPGE